MSGGPGALIQALRLRTCEERPSSWIHSIAGPFDETGRVFGLMPHPERAKFAVHHPDWTGAATFPAEDEGDGARVFKNAVSYLKS